MSIYEFNDYKAFVRDWVTSRPKGGRGEFRQMALHLSVSSTMISQVFSGDKHINMELASDLADYLGLNEAETDFFFLLLELARAGTDRLRKKLMKRVTDLQTKSKKISERVVKTKELTSEEKATYYSSWMFTGVRNLLACDPTLTTPRIADELKVSEAQVRGVIQFLLDAGLLSLDGGKYTIQSKATHLEGESPLVIKHHQNWRLRGMQKMDWQDEKHLFYTGPMSLSHTDAAKVREMLLEVLGRINKIVVDSPSETVRCLNFDWFHY